jgi:hypothetical protein
MVKRPMFIYSSTVWWLRVRYKVIILELHKLQGLTCLAILGAMQIAAAAEIEVTLGLLPLNLMTEVEAYAGTYTLMCIQQWKPVSIMLVMPENFGTWSMNQSYIRGMTE